MSKEKKVKQPKPVQKPKCPRCANKKPAKKDCGYCGGFGRI